MDNFIKTYDEMRSLGSFIRSREFQKSVGQEAEELNKKADDMADSIRTGLRSMIEDQKEKIAFAEKELALFEGMLDIANHNAFDFWAMKTKVKYDLIFPERQDLFVREDD